MKDKGLNKGLVQPFETSKRGEKDAYFGFRKMFWDYLNKLHVVFSDPCCTTATGDDKDPVAWDESQGQFVRWNGTAWVAITAFTTTTTTTTTAAPTTTTTTTTP